MPGIHAAATEAGLWPARSVRAGKHQPVVGSDLPERLIRRLETCRRPELKNRNLDGFRAKSSQRIAQLASLVRGARYRHAAAGERQAHCDAPDAAISSGPRTSIQSVRFRTVLFQYHLILGHHNLHAAATQNEAVTIGARGRVLEHPSTAGMSPLCVADSRARAFTFFQNVSAPVLWLRPVGHPHSPQADRRTASGAVRAAPNLHPCLRS